MTARCAAATLCWAVIPALPALLFLPIGGRASQHVAGSLNKSVVRLARSENGYDAVLIFHLASRTLSLRVEPKAETRGTPLPMSGRLDLWRPLLGQLFQQRPGVDSYLLTVGEYPELAGRIAVAAACSGKWNPQTGQPHIGNASKALKALLDDPSLYRELDSFFDAMGYRTSIDSAEGIVLCPWKQFSENGAHLPCRAKLESESLMPCGASLVFRLVKKAVP